jgi:hypothetical protein
MAAHIPDYTTDDIPIPEALKRLEDQGAAVVGLNCSRGPDMMMSLLKKVREVCKVYFDFFLSTKHCGIFLTRVCIFYSNIMNFIGFDLNVTLNFKESLS